MRLLALQAAYRALQRSFDRRDMVFEGQHTRCVTAGDIDVIRIYYCPPVMVAMAPMFDTPVFA